MTDVPFIYFNYKKPLPFHVPEAWKRYPFRGEPLYLGHYSTPSSCTENSTWYSDIVWYELHQTFRAHEEVLWLFYDNFHFSSKERDGFGISFFGRGGGGWLDSGKGHQGYFTERQMATVRLWSLLIRVRKMSELGSIRVIILVYTGQTDLKQIVNKQNNKMIFYFRG